ncbi:RES family NAD+ phosphorylase [Mangrovicoccus ximenensis]|uniref:RES family NAD+ phosphorylase n=1 Tax=Mangrovicoccus ximenensis TaxID=1911570 RepID=UPI000D3C6F1F|nr:RES domain-containing protein [Mangrovicoccus ximenensis]
MTELPGRRFAGPVFRAHNPEWAYDPASGEGARRHGGRFNRRGRAALYSALSPLGAIREASPLGRPMEPVTLCEYAVDCAGVFDATDPRMLAAEGVAPPELDCPDWELRMLRGDPVPPQDLAERLVARGYAALMVQSFARGAGPSDVNLVFWTWTGRPPHQVRVVDSIQRLPRDRSSWQ